MYEGERSMFEGERSMFEGERSTAEPERDKDSSSVARSAVSPANCCGVRAIS